MPNVLECVHLSKSFDGNHVLEQIDFTARDGQILALLGPSGCGKTTTLRLIAGFDWPDSGKIIINGRVVAGDGERVPAEQRRVGMVFQEYALFPHLNVAENIAFGLAGRPTDKQTRVEEMLKLVGLSGFGERSPHELSGGQQQRVALARALAPRPDILLLDEPFSNLDSALRSQVRSEVRAILKQAGITAVFVTHDQEEALSLADVVAVILKGRVAQMDEPQQLYQCPTTREVAAFVGEANFVPAEAEGETAACALGTVYLTKPTFGPVDLLLRPEALALTSDDGAGEGAVAEIVWREFYGHDQRLGLTLPDGTMLVARVDSEQRFTVGERVQVSVTRLTQSYPR